MESRVAQAVERKRNGMNCAQAVACTYCDLAGLDEATMAAVTQALGTGIGGTLEGTCGAITGACTVLGLAGKDAGRMQTMANARQMIQQFKEKNHSVTCKVLKGVETGAVLRSCEGCVEDAAQYLESILDAQE